MATEFNTGGKVRTDDAARERMNVPVDRAPSRSGWGMIAALAAVAILIAIGMFVSLRDVGTTASTGTPGATTGSTASPSNPPPAPGPAGQGESNSTR